MKYSLRSLMTFSIRDIALVTMIVALVLGWWVDHRSSQMTIQAKDSEITKARRDLVIEKLENPARWVNNREPTFPALAPSP